MERHGSTRPPRWLALLAGALVWTSADGERHAGGGHGPPPRPALRSPRAPDRHRRIREFYYPAPAADRPAPSSEPPPAR